MRDVYSETFIHHSNTPLPHSYNGLQKNIMDLFPRAQELCESRGGGPGLSVLMSLTVSVDVKQN